MQKVGLEPMGGAGETVEIDETFIGRLEGVPKAKGGAAHKNVVLTLVQRGGEPMFLLAAQASILSFSILFQIAALARYMIVLRILSRALIC